MGCLDEYLVSNQVLIFFARPPLLLYLLIYPFPPALFVACDYYPRGSVLWLLEPSRGPAATSMKVRYEVLIFRVLKFVVRAPLFSLACISFVDCHCC